MPASIMPPFTVLEADSAARWAVSSECVPTKQTSGSPREILRRLRMTAFGDPSSLVRPVCKLVGNAESPLLL